MSTLRYSSRPSIWHEIDDQIGLSAPRLVDLMHYA